MSKYRVRVFCSVDGETREIVPKPLMDEDAAHKLARSIIENGLAQSFDDETLTLIPPHMIHRVRIEWGRRV
jgi:hypothetical protein